MLITWKQMAGISGSSLWIFIHSSGTTIKPKFPLLLFYYENYWDHLLFPQDESLSFCTLWIQAKPPTFHTMQSYSDRLSWKLQSSLLLTGWTPNITVFLVYKTRLMNIITFFGQSASVSACVLNVISEWTNVFMQMWKHVIVQWPFQAPASGQISHL